MSTVTEIIAAVKQLDERAKGEGLEKLEETDVDEEWERKSHAEATAGGPDPSLAGAMRKARRISRRA